MSDRRAALGSTGDRQRLAVVAVRKIKYSPWGGGTACLSTDLRGAEGLAWRRVLHDIVVCVACVKRIYSASGFRALAWALSPSAGLAFPVIRRTRRLAVTIRISQIAWWACSIPRKARLHFGIGGRSRPA